MIFFSSLGLDRLSMPLSSYLPSQLFASEYQVVSAVKFNIQTRLSGERNISL